MHPIWISSVIVRADEDTIQPALIQPVTQKGKSKHELNVYSSICLPHSLKRENFSLLCRKNRKMDIEIIDVSYRTYYNNFLK